MREKRQPVAVAVSPEAGGFAVLLDGKPARTPAGHALTVPYEALAEAVAGEWRDSVSPLPPGEGGASAPGEGPALQQSQALTPSLSQRERGKMPLTALAALAIDVVRPRRAGVEKELLAYGETDQLLYREDREEALRERQRERLDPWVKWAEGRYGVTMKATRGVLPAAQPEGNRERYARALGGYDEWRLAALAALVKTCCSLILGLAAMEGALAAADALALSRLEEDYQAERWGKDEEAAARRETLLRDVRAAEEWARLLKETVDRSAASA